MCLSVTPRLPFQSPALNVSLTDMQRDVPVNRSSCRDTSLAPAAPSHVAAEEQILLLLAEVDSNSGIPADITAAIDTSGQDARYLLLAEYG